MASGRVLICGAGVAGSILAFWLAKDDYQVVVVERSRLGQKIGQGLEIEQPALKVVEAMGVLQRLQEKRTGEKGFNLVDQQSHSHALLEAGGISPTGALEIMRGDLTQVLYEAANESANVAFRFSTTIRSLAQTPDKVTVELESRNDQSITTEDFDFVVGADGFKSRTRHLVMGSPEMLGCFKPVGAYNAYFSIPSEPHDWPYSRLCHFSNRRAIWIRPIAEKSATTSVYFIHLPDGEIPALTQANAAGDRLKQKQALAELYSGLGWETNRIIEQMMKTDNFYSDELMQVKLDKWSDHRVVLLGDAAWAPTPFTGQGNQLAIVGAWVLAQEISRNKKASPPAAAFDAYEKRLRAYVEASQNIPLGGRAPYIFVPQTSLGIWLLRKSLGLLAQTVRLFTWLNLASWLPNKPEDEFDLQMQQ